MTERWLPVKHRLPNGLVVGRLLHTGADWQVFGLRGGGNVLAARRSLVDRWTRGGLVADTLFEPTDADDMELALLFAGPDQRIEPVADARLPRSAVDCISFALSLRETRKLEAETPLHDALYVERYSRLLPTWTISEAASDEEVLGRWLTGGVSVPATSFRRVAALVGWLDKTDIRTVVEKAGLGGSASEMQAQGRRAGETAEIQRTETRRDCAEDVGIERSQSRQFRLVGRRALEAFIREHVIDIVENAEHYEALGIHFPSSVVLHGPPGCGKTFALQRLTEHLDWPMYTIDSGSVGSPYIHETARKVGELFAKAIAEAPSIVVIEEMEVFLSERQATARYQVEEVGEFLQRIPEACDRKVLVVGTTNRLDMLDAAILRRGRFDHVVEVDMPTTEEVSELLDELLRKMPTNEEIDTHDVVKALNGRPLSDVAFVVREGARLAARDGKRILDANRLRAALSSLPRTGSTSPIGFARN